jgi:hypothetical protein
LAQLSLDQLFDSVAIGVDTLIGALDQADPGFAIVTL